MENSDLLIVIEQKHVESVSKMTINQWKIIKTELSFNSPIANLLIRTVLSKK